MISNSNTSKMPGSGEFSDFQKYIGVASVNVLAVNPNNATLKKYGWTIEDGAPEPNYTHQQEVDGKIVTSARVRFLVQIQDLKEKPVISLDFWCRPELNLNRDGNKCQFIDSFGRTAWGTKADLTAKRVPQYTNGPARISWPYKMAHRGEENIIKFLLKYLNITPLQVFDRASNSFVDSKNPGQLTIDAWDKLCAGDATELRQYVSLQPDNCVKVILGIRTTEDNRSYQTFMPDFYLSNGAMPDKTTGIYNAAAKAIAASSAKNTLYAATPVSVWKEQASEVTDHSGTMFDEDGNYIADEPVSPVDDLPFFEE